MRVKYLYFSLKTRLGRLISILIKYLLIGSHLWNGDYIEIFAASKTYFNLTITLTVRVKFNIFFPANKLDEKCFSQGVTLLKGDKAFVCLFVCFYFADLQNVKTPANFTEYSILSAAETLKGGARFILGKYNTLLYHFFISCVEFITSK